MSYTFATARFLAAQKAPYLTAHLMSLIPVESPGLGTMAVDKWGRVYYDPACFSKWSLSESATVIIHEDMHILFRHSQRSAVKFGETLTPYQAKLWNIAADISINDTIDELGTQLPPGCCYSHVFGLQKNLLTEEYYDLLDKKAQSMRSGKSGGGDGSGGLQEDALGQSGSGADGQPRPWEQGEPSQSEPGLDEFDKASLERVTAHAIEKFERDERANGRGTVPANLRRLARDILRPKVNPARELEAACKFAVSSSRGYGMTTWAKLNRRQPPGSMRLPAHIRPVPRICVIIDTSGSMSEDDLALALGTISDVIKAMPNKEGLTVITGDTRAASCQRVFGPDAVTLDGGGGTDMGRIIKDVAQRVPRFDSILVATDGYTPWCDPVTPKVVAAITQPRHGCEPPEWIKTVYLNGDSDND